MPIGGYDILIACYKTEEHFFAFLFPGHFTSDPRLFGLVNVIELRDTSSTPALFNSFTAVAPILRQRIRNQMSWSLL